MIREIVEATIKECYPKFRSVTILPDDFETQVFNKVLQQVGNLNISQRKLLISYTLKMQCCTQQQAEKMVDSYLAINNTMKNIPKKIYLQIDEDGETPEDFKELSDVTWCEDRINDSDLEYILNDNIMEDF